MRGSSHGNVAARRLLGLARAWVWRGFLAMAGAALAAEPGGEALAVARPPRKAKVDFDLQVMPALRANCLPCHNKSVAKADLVLETPGDMIHGGESGAALKPGNAAASMVFQLAAHRDKPRMPPRANKVNAVDLTPEQLGLLAQWIDQGAKPSPKREEAVAWRPMPSAVQPILAAAVSADGRYAACGRGNRIDVYRLKSGEPLGALVDPGLAVTNAPGIAHRDEVNALAMSADGLWLASGGYREIKLWRREVRMTGRIKPSGKASAPRVAPADPGLWPPPRLGADAELVCVDGRAVRLTAGTNAAAVGFLADLAATEAAAAAERTAARCAVERTFRDEAATAARKEGESQRERLKKAAAGLEAASKPAEEKEAALQAALRRKAEAEAAVAGLAQGASDARKAAEQKLKEASQAAEKAEAELKPAKEKREGARNELDLAAQGVNRAEAALLAAQAALDRAAAALTAAKEAQTRATARAGEGVPPVLAAFVTGDRRWVVTAHTDQRVRLWNATNGAPVDTLECGFQVRALESAGLGRARVQSDAGEWRELALAPEWRLAGRIGSESGPSRFPDRITALAFRPDGGLLAAGGGEPSRRGEITLIDPRTGAVTTNFPTLHSDTVLSLAFSPDGQFLASGGADRYARILESPGGRLWRALEGHTGHVLAVAWSPDGRTLATGGADLSVKLWDPVSGEKRKQGGGFTREVTALAFLAEPGRLAAASGEGAVRVLNDRAEKSAELAGPTDFTYAVAVSGDGALLAAGGQDGVLRVWDAARGVLVWQAPPQGGAVEAGKLAGR